MQNLLAIIRGLFLQLKSLFNGGENWFLVIDEEFVAQETSANQEKKFASERYQISLKDNFNRAYESDRRLSSERLTFGELWSTLNPISIINFLRYTLSDVV